MMRRNPLSAPTLLLLALGSLLGKRGRLWAPVEEPSGQDKIGLIQPPLRQLLPAVGRSRFAATGCKTGPGPGASGSGSFGVRNATIRTSGLGQLPLPGSPT